jgi:hypothetical protein
MIADGIANRWLAKIVEQKVRWAIHHELSSGRAHGSRATAFCSRKLIEFVPKHHMRFFPF